MPLMKIESFFQNLTPVELKIAKSETFDLFDYNSKTIHHRYVNYAFSKSLCQEECISKGFGKKN